MTNNWISCTERLPPDYHEVLYFAINDSGNREITTGHRENGRWTHCCLFYSTIVLNDLVTVTHWQELPAYPAKINDEKDSLSGKELYNIIMDRFKKFEGIKIDSQVKDEMKEIVCSVLKEHGIWDENDVCGDIRIRINPETMQVTYTFVQGND